METLKSLQDEASKCPVLSLRLETDGEHD